MVQHAAITSGIKINRREISKLEFNLNVKRYKQNKKISIEHTAKLSKKGGIIIIMKTGKMQLRETETEEKSLQPQRSYIKMMQGKKKRI